MCEFIFSQGSFSWLVLDIWRKNCAKGLNEVSLITTLAADTKKAR
jgi:hypothetical protein